ncbi:hypothetical protein ACGFNX_19470 [Streptomyces sp. NPDC048723]|uniref:hypothetical protein n=1 Tax=Streptomyces sp. NPDC048723 TaxID=3365589 RepID=UPI003718EC8C
MPKRSSRSAFTTAASVALALSAAALTTGCGQGQNAAPPAAAAKEASATAPIPSSPSTSSPPSPAAPADAGQPGQSAAPPVSQPPNRATEQGRTDAGVARTAAVKPEGLEKLPVQKTLGWKPDGPLTSQDLHGQKITLNECTAVSGAALWQQQGYLSTARNSAGQQLFGFADAESAKSAYGRLVADMNNCQATSRTSQEREGVPQDAVVTTTATTASGTAWSRKWTGTGGMSARGRQTNHLYAVQQGDRITLFQFDELAERPAPPHDTGNDTAMLGALAELGPQH